MLTKQHLAPSDSQMRRIGGAPSTIRKCLDVIKAEMSRICLLLHVRQCDTLAIVFLRQPCRGNDNGAVCAA